MSEKPEPKIIPNVAKSEEGKWYVFQSEYKIEEVEKKDSPDYDETNYPHYKFTIKFPDDARTGIFPKDLVIVGKDKSWSCHYYGAIHEEIEDYIIRMANKIKSLKNDNERLRTRNRKLEHHFTKTFFDEEQINLRESREKEMCEYCNKEINKKTELEGRDWFYLVEEGIMHVDCGVKSFDHKCDDCGMVTSHDYIDGDGCPECSGKVRKISQKQVKQSLLYSVLKKYLPKELHDKVMLKDIRIK